MELKSGEEAEHTTRYLFGCDRKTVVLGDWCLSKDIDTTGRPRQDSPAVETEQALTGNPMRLHVLRPNDPLTVCDL